MLIDYTMNSITNISAPTVKAFAPYGVIDKPFTGGALYIMKRAGVYKIQSKIKPKKIYIGSSVDLRHRRVQHFHSLKNGNHFNKKLQFHCNKYGIEDLIFSVIVECDRGDAIRHEQFYIDALRPWFNNAPLAESNLGYKHDAEFKKKISEVQRGKKLSEEHRRNIGLGHKGKKHSEEWCKKIGAAHKGKKLSEEHKKKLSIAKLGNKCHLGFRYTASEETKEKIRNASMGRKVTEATRKKISLSRIGIEPWNKGKTGVYSPETLNKMRRKRNHAKRKEDIDANN